MQLSQIITGRRKPTAKEKARIAELLSVPATALFPEENEAGNGN
jgi:transcriptional regulator with XRE-family HTH domain